MKPNYNILRMSELRALTRERGLRGYSRLRKDGSIAFLRDSIWMQTNYNNLRLVELRVLGRECGLQDYYRLKRAELIEMHFWMRCSTTGQCLCLFDWLMWTIDPEAQPNLQSLRDLLPPPSESSLTPYELEQGFTVYRSFELTNEAGWMWKPSSRECY